MANQVLVKTLDYILNRCNEQEIEAVAAAVVRRRRDIAMFGGRTTSIPNPKNLAKEISTQFNMEGHMEGLTASIRDYAIRIIKEQAPELTEKQIEELTNAWIPSSLGKQAKGSAKSPGSAKSTDSAKPIDIPQDVLVAMIGQFVSFSLGRMEEEDDKALRREMGPWPDKYWKAFPQVIRLLIKDLLNNEIDEREFNSRVGLALEIT